MLFDSLEGDHHAPTLYHYVSETHSLECRASFSEEIWESLMRDQPHRSFLVGLSSVIWRESWKYGERAFRYSQHDIGHAVAAIRFSAALCGWKLKLVSSWSTDNIATLLGLNRQEEFLEEESEETELLAVVTPNIRDKGIAFNFPIATKMLIEKIAKAKWYGQPNRLSHKHVSWPVIDEVAAAS